MNLLSRNMNKIQIQLESAIEKELNRLVSDNFEYKIGENHIRLTKIRAVELFQNIIFDDNIKNGESHIIPIYGIVSAIIKTNNGSKNVNLSFRQSTVEVKFDWDNEVFLIKDIEKFRFSSIL
jgi:hypothetical protein